MSSVKQIHCIFIKPVVMHLARLFCLYKTDVLYLQAIIAHTIYLRSIETTSC